MKEYVTPTITEIIDGMECVDLKSGDNKDQLKWKVCWTAHNGGHASVLSLVLLTCHPTKSISGMLYYKGPGEMVISDINFNNGIDFGLNTVVTQVYKNYYRFSTDINTAGSSDNKRINLGEFRFKDEFGQFKDVGMGDAKGAFQHTNDGRGDGGGTIYDAEIAGSTANDVIYVFFD